MGGFAASDWLFTKVYKILTPLGLNVIRPESHVLVFFTIKTTLTNQKNFRSKAVSDGAISFYLDHFVRARVSKITYGYFCHIPYQPNAPDHSMRSHKVSTSSSGCKQIGDFFDIILPKVKLFNLFPKYAIKTTFYL